LKTDGFFELVGRLFEALLIRKFLCGAQEFLDALRGGGRCFLLFPIEFLRSEILELERALPTAGRFPSLQVGQQVGDLGVAQVRFDAEALLHDRVQCVVGVDVEEARRTVRVLGGGTA
jgi:hypothetical protein